MKRYIYVFIILIFALSLAFTLIKPFVADVYFKYGKDALSKGEFDIALSNFNMAIRINPKESSYYKNRAQCYAEMNNLSSSFLDLITGLSINPNDTMFIRNSFYVYYLLASKDPFYIPITKAMFLNTKKRYSTDVGVLVDIAKYEKVLGWEGDYSTSLMEIEKLRPDILKWHPDLLD